MKNILFVTPYYYPHIVGGAEISTQIIAELYSESVQILTMDVFENFKNINNVNVIKVSENRLSKLWEKVLNDKHMTLKDKINSNFHANVVDRKLVIKYKKIFINRKIEVIICNSNVEVMGRASLWKAAFECRIPLYLMVRDPMLLEKKIFGYDVSNIYINLIKKQSSNIAGFIAPSKFMLDLYKSKGFEMSFSKVVPNAVDVPFSPPYYDSNNLDIVYAGNISKKKGILTLISAILGLVDKYPKIRLRLFGRGELSDYCKKYKFIELNSWVEKDVLYNEFRKCRLFVLPAEWPEAFGRVIIEAVSQGTIAVGSNAGGIPEIFQNDVRYIFESGNKDEMAKCIERVINLDKEQYEAEVLLLQKNFKRYNLETYKNNWGKVLNGL